MADGHDRPGATEHCQAILPPVRKGPGRLRSDPRIPPTSLPDERDLSRLVGQVYDAALGDEDWSVVVERLSRALGGNFAVLHRSAEPTQPDGAVRFNADPAYIALYNQHYHQTVPLPPEAARPRAPTAFLFSAIMAEPDFVRTEYYSDFLRPQGHHSWMGWADIDHRGLRAHLSLWRPAHRDVWDAPQLRILSAIGPHLGRALEFERRLAAATAPHAIAADAGLLAPRERDCLACVARGASSKQAGRLLGLSMNTVNAYLASARRKLKAASRSEAVATALQMGLLDA
jgi:DNA-binding CsgD family transcriptional regulator